MTGSASSTTDVVVDALSTRIGGGITDLLNLLPALSSECPQLRPTVVLSRRYQTELMDRLRPEISICSVDVPPMPSLKRMRFLKSELPRIVERTDAKVVLLMGELISGNAGRPIVAVVRNFNLFARFSSFGFLGSDVRGSLNRLSAQPFVRRLLTRADHLIFVSEAFRNVVCKRYPKVAEKSSVAHLGVDTGFSTQPLDEAYPPPADRYVLSVSGIAPYKNQVTLITAFSRLVTRSGLEDLTLVLAGNLMQRRPYAGLVDLSRELGVERQVRFAGPIPHLGLPAWYRAALVHVMPSLLETFGHPYLEAMACGAPVLASDIPVAHEICGDAAEYFPATDAEELERLMRDIIRDDGRRYQLIERGRRRVERFSWSHTASVVGAQLIRAASKGAG
jgi:glycosyltransferase involved in cell wall biosynthesis